MCGVFFPSLPTFPSALRLAGERFVFSCDGVFLYFSTLLCSATQKVKAVGIVRDKVNMGKCHFQMSNSFRRPVHESAQFAVLHGTPSPGNPTPDLTDAALSVAACPGAPLRCPQSQTDISRVAWVLHCCLGPNLTCKICVKLDLGNVRSHTQHLCFH